MGFPDSSACEESACHAGATGHAGSIRGSGRSPQGGNGNPLQYSCLENPMDRGTWWATVQKVTKSWTWLRIQHAHADQNMVHGCCSIFLINEYWYFPANNLPTVSYYFLLFFKSFYFFICSEFCHTLKWNSHGFTCDPHPDPPSHLPLHPIPLGLPSAPAPSACLMHPTWAGDLFHPW